MFALFLALLIVWPIIEIYLFVVVVGQIGFFWALMIIFASTFSGIAILRYRGPRHWAKFRGALNERRPPAREAFNGFMITTGAVLLIIPGYLTSVLALFLLFPPTRYLVGVVAMFLLPGRFKIAATGATWSASKYQDYRGGGRQQYDIDGEAFDVTDETGESPPSGPGQLPSPESPTQN